MRAGELSVRKALMRLLAGGFAACACVAARAEILAYDGFKPSDGGYVSGQKIAGKSSPYSFGFTGNWGPDTATIAVSTGAELDRPDTDVYPVTGKSFNMTYGNNDGYRSIRRKFAAGAFPASGTVYVSLAMITRNTPFSQSDWKGADDHRAIFGFSSKEFSNATMLLPAVRDFPGLFFGFVSVDGTMKPAVVCNGVTRTFAGLDYADNRTYYCEAKIEYGAGDGGTDRISCNICVRPNWVPCEGDGRESSWPLVFDAALVPPTCLLGSFLLRVNNGSVIFDEVCVATAYQDTAGLVASVLGGDETFTGTPYPLDGETFTRTPGAGKYLMPSQPYSAPARFNHNDVTYDIYGYRIEQKGADGAWTTLEEKTDGTRTLVCPKPVNDAETRAVWLARRAARRQDGAPLPLNAYLRMFDIDYAGSALTAKNDYAGRAHKIFDGRTFLTDAEGKGAVGDARFLMTIAEDSFVQLAMPTNRTFAAVKYRPYTLTCWDNEIARAPTAWRIDVKGPGQEDFVVLDARAGIDWTGTKYNTRNENYKEFDVPAGKPAFNTIRFVPLDSVAHQRGDTVNTAGLMELEVYVLPVNPAGTLQVKIGQGEYSDAGFSHAHDAVLDAAATVTAGDGIVRATPSGNVRVGLQGYVLERYDPETATWIVEEESAARSYAFTPEAGVSRRLTWIADTAAAPRYQVTAESDACETGVVTFAPAPDDDGYYIAGTEVTATAVTPAGATLVGWTGDLEGVTGTDGAVLTFTADRPRKLVPIFDRPWKVSGSGTEMALTDGAWTFTAAAADAAARQLKIVKWQSGAGRLNLDTAVTHADTGAAWTITRVESEALAENMLALTAVTDLTLPRTLTSVGSSAFRTKDDGILTLTNLVMNCPELTSLGSTCFTRQRALAGAVVKLPRLETFGTEYTFYNAPFTATDFAAWDFSALKAVTKDTFHCEYYLSAEQFGCAGKLSFPKLETVGSGAFIQFCAAAEMELGTARGSLRSIAGVAFQRANGITNLVIGCGAGLTVAANAFLDVNCNMGGGVPAVRFTHHAPSRAALEAILTGNTAARLARVSVSRFHRAWEDYVTPTAEIDDADVRAAAQAAGADGAFKTSAGEWKAIVFAEKQPSDPRGTVVTVR